MGTAKVCLNKAFPKQLFHTVSTVYLHNRNVILKLVYVYLFMSLVGSSVNFNFKKKLRKLFAKRKEATDVKNIEKQKKGDSQFKQLAQLLYSVGDYGILRILVLQVGIIFVKIWLSMSLISIDSQLVSSLFSKKINQFTKLSIKWLAIGLPMSYLSSLSQYLTNTLSKRLITNVSNKLMDSYLSTKRSSEKTNLNTFYKVNNLTRKFKDAHQRISIDVFELCNNLSSVPVLVLNPAISLAISSHKIFSYDNGSMTEVVLLFGLLINLSTMGLKVFSPNFSRISNSYSQHESNFRQVHSNVINHYEQIALWRSWDRELYDADCYYFILERFMRRSYRKMALYNFVKTFLIKYTWGAFGLGLCAFPIFKNHFHNIEDAKSVVTQNFTQNRSLLMNASNSLGDLLSSKKNIDQIIGTSRRVIEFERSLQEVDDSSLDSEKSEAVISHNNDLIKFVDVPLVAPNGSLLCEPLNFEIKHGQNLLILGPNGSGKSSLFRVLSGLWPTTQGELIIPEYNSIFYLPQRPYLMNGRTNLIEQIIYPKPFEVFEKELTKTNFKQVHRDLITVLKVLELDYLLKENYDERNEGVLEFGSGNKHERLRNTYIYDSDDSSDDEGNSFDSMVSILYLNKDWSQELSLGSQQKLAMARLYYHKPKFAVLDECTSQVTPEMEDKMYTYATKTLNISVLSVAHRTSLWKFHEYLLQFDGKGKYLFKKFDHMKRLKLTEEKLEIEKSLMSLPTLKTKLEELMIVKENQLTLRV